MADIVRRFIEKEMTVEDCEAIHNDGGYVVIQDGNVKEICFEE